MTRKWLWPNLWNYSVRHFPGKIENTMKPQQAAFLAQIRT